MPDKPLHNQKADGIMDYDENAWFTPMDNAPIIKDIYARRVDFDGSILYPEDYHDYGGLYTHVPVAHGNYPYESYDEFDDINDLTQRMEER